MRTINVSTEVFAAIWAAHRPGEKDESEILSRVLGAAGEAETSPPVTSMTGFRDLRSGVSLPEGFEIFRVYKGTEYRARATDGKWLLLNTGATYPSLNQLSRAVSASPENAWQSWYYLDGDKRVLVQALRK